MGLRSRSRDRSWGWSESNVLAGVGVGAGVGKLGPLRPGVAVYHPSTDDYFGRTVIHPPENIERQEEKDSSSVQIKLKRHLVMEFRLIKVYEIILGPSRSICDCVIAFKD